MNPFFKTGLFGLSLASMILASWSSVKPIKADYDVVPSGNLCVCFPGDKWRFCLLPQR